MGFIIGHRGNYNGLGVLKSQRHLPSKNLPMTPLNFYPTTPQPPQPLVLIVINVLLSKIQRQSKGAMPHHFNVALFSFIDWNDFNKTSQSRDEQTLMTNGSEKTGLNLKQKSDPSRNPSQFPITFLRSTSYFLLLLYLFLGRYRVNKSELRFSTSHVTPFMRFIESRLS